METSEKYRIALRDNVKYYCTAQGLSYELLSRKMGVSKACAWRFVWDDSTNPKLETLVRIANALDITVIQLLGDKL